MAQDHLTRELSRRFKELGLPPSLMEIDEFRERFLDLGWVMYVRDNDAAADVHLIQPKKAIIPHGRNRAGRRKAIRKV